MSIKEELKIIFTQILFAAFWMSAGIGIFFVYAKAMGRI